MTWSKLPRAPWMRLMTAAVMAWQLSSTDATAQVAWSSADTVSGILSNLGPTRVAVDSGGAVTVAWTEPAAAARLVKVAHRPMGGGWTMASPVGIVTDVADVALAATPSAGGALLVWTAADGSVQAERRSASGAWDPEQIVAPNPMPAHAPALAVDAAGNAVALWSVGIVDRIQAARYDAGRGVWEAVVDLGGGVWPMVDVDGAGNAVAAWTGRTGAARAVLVRHFAAATGLWGAPVILDTNAQVIALDLDVASDGAAAVLWYDEDSPRTASALAVALRAPGLDAWGPATVLSTTSPTGAVAVGPGMAMAVWTTGEGAMSSQAPVTAGAATWTSAQPIDPSILGPSGLSFDIAADGLGDAVATWTVGTSGLASHYSHSTATWATATRLTAAGIATRAPTTAITPRGTATVTWVAEVWPYAAVQATQWIATLPPPVVRAVVPGAGALTLDFTPPTALLSEFALSAIEYSVDGGTTWLARAPASATSPLVVAGLTDGAAYAVRLRAINAGGPGEGSASLIATPGTGSTAPGGLEVSEIEGDEVTLTWDAPAFGARPQGYLVEGGVVPGQALVVAATGTAAPVARYRLPPGAYFVRVRAIVLGAVSGVSNEVRVALTTAIPPAAPRRLLGAVAGSALALSWSNTFEGGRPEALWLVVHGPVSGVVPLGLVEAFEYGAVPAGTYTFEVVATNIAGASQPSNAVTVTFPGPCTGRPGMPTRFVLTQQGPEITLRWSPPDSGAAVTGYRVIVGTPGDAGAPAGAGAERPAYGFTVPVSGRRITGTVPPGFYVFFVHGVNACGDGPVAGPLTVDVR